ncbi:DNA polymerase IV [Arenicella chitinivorans]|uniref:DNA polymerase IV n=1 Tax=Arenicella chitinivorans TaxID=1329800 RepID=A0A918RRE7_9GAMM|nr:DNA polymerase IV [Arenicella chitinivorans]GHA10284.1 DNA polymerase IV [Arenicella chitinivorans]
MTARKILHIDMDAFFASVEQRDFPHLRGKPVIVGGKPESRGVVAACSYEARKFGVHSAMPSARAHKLCREAVFVPARFDAYRAASTGIHAVFKRYTDMIEPLSLDEAYLDVTAQAEALGSATEVAKRIKREIKLELDLTASAGVSYNKFLAKIASDMDKPDGLYVIRPELAQRFIDQLPIRKFFGVGKVTEQKMHRLGIFTGADLKARTELELQTAFGQSGGYYYRVARGIDDRPVRAHRVRKSLGKETTFSRDVTDKKFIWQTLLELAESLETALENKQMMARSLTLKLRYADFKLITRSKTGISLYTSAEDIVGDLPELLRKTEAGARPIRLIGITLSNLYKHIDEQSKSAVSEVRDSPQLGLF